MGNIHVFKMSNMQQWDEVVRSFKNHDIYYMSGYVKAFEQNGDGEPLLFYYEDASVRYMNVTFKRDISRIKSFGGIIEKNTCYDLKTPYGYGGILVEGRMNSQAISAYKRYCAEHGIVCEVVRFHPLRRNWKDCLDLYNDDCLGKTVYIDTTNRELIWQNISSKNRNMIRKAMKSGLKTYWGRSPELCETFMRLYNETMQRNKADSYYFFSQEFHQSILEDLKQNAMWFYTMKEGEVYSIAVFLFCNGLMHYHLSASSEAARKDAASNLLLYEAALWANQNNYRALHLGGGNGAQEDSLYKFKKSFNRNDDLEFHIGTVVFDEEMYQKLISIRKKDPTFVFDADYVPGYRL